eukprot:366490-Chlamydomonas_euryale.AAC.22
MPLVDTALPVHHSWPPTQCQPVCYVKVDPMVFNMLSEDPGKVDYSQIGGLSEQIRELRESIELPLMNPELFIRVGINPPKVCRMHLVRHTSCACMLRLASIWTLNHSNAVRLYALRMPLCAVSGKLLALALATHVIATARITPCPPLVAVLYFLQGVLLYGPPGTGKTLLARAIASNIDANFLKVVSSAIVDKYIGESARVIREMFGYARDHQPCVIFMDEIDAIGGRRFSEGTSADREIQRTLMELLSQLDGFDILGKVKMIMATNRPDVLDPALLRPGRLDRKIEIPLPNEAARMEILKIHAASLAKHGDIDYEAVVKLAENFNGADLRNICTEAGMFAIRDERDYTVHEDFMKAVRKLVEAKKLESSLSYDSSFGDGGKQ